MDSSFRNATLVIAGGACLIVVIARLFSPFYDLIPVRGAWLATLLVTPLLCFWCGMLLHFSIGGKTRGWFQVLAGLLAVVMLYLSRHTVNAPNMGEQASTYLFLFFLGFVLPWNHLRENGDRLGAKSAILCVLTSLCYAALYLVWQRLGERMEPRFVDMEQFILVLMTNMLPLATVPPLMMATEFAFSRAGQWLGTRKWFLWLVVPAALICFLGAWFRRPFHISLDLSWETTYGIRLIVQPVTIYLMVVIWRTLRGLAKSRIEWKEVFRI